MSHASNPHEDKITKLSNFSDEDNLILFLVSPVDVTCPFQTTGHVHLLVHTNSSFQWSQKAASWMEPKEAIDIYKPNPNR